MNLSHEFTRGVSYKREAQHWRDTVTRIGPGAIFVANADDPLVAWAAREAPRVVWVSGGLFWRENALLCRGCLRPLAWDGPSFSCEQCGLHRPDPAWSIDGGTFVTPEGRLTPALAMPGRANLTNGLFAVATADLFGVPLPAAMEAVGRVGEVDGRFAAFEVDGRLIRLHMIKNSASWNETLQLLAADPEAGVVLAIDDFGLTGRDTATIWDTPVELLRGRRVVATGVRRDDIAVRLEVAGAAVETVAGHLDGVRRCPPGPVHVVTNYSAFNALKRRLTR
jgi:hypothetical protein